MCTALSFNQFFGRNLDYEFSYGEQVAVTPRNYDFHFRHLDKHESHYALIGMAHVFEEYPLYYDAMNEKGLGMAGLNFVGNAKFYEVQEDKNNVAAFEFIPWILSQCASVKEARVVLENTNVCATPFNEQFPVAELHYMISDENESIVVECMEDGMHVYDNPTHVLTNNPPFPMQLFRLNDYMYLSNKQPKNNFGLDLTAYSRGFGAMGLPGDLSSGSRFVRVAYTRANATSDKNDLNQYFHIIGSVTQQKGLCEVEPGKYEYTIYTSCCDLRNGIYYYTTYNNHQISGVNMFNENLDSEVLISYPILEEEMIHMQN